MGYLQFIAGTDPDGNNETPGIQDAYRESKKQRTDLVFNQELLARTQVITFPGRFYENSICIDWHLRTGYLFCLHINACPIRNPFS
jgi:hypothetical protein